MTKWSINIAGANAGWRTQFRFRWSRHRSGVARLVRCLSARWSLLVLGEDAVGRRAAPKDSRIGETDQSSS